ncbi:LpqB family beta-propeller domain-containing protein [uncultured Microbacterium sp.]|uniref:LpqB family beta-propeller domain-containing protein n=1 Tax=uncultured Microbacterium sp. TaxID=191216 RepID=UPI0035CB7029
MSIHSAARRRLAAVALAVVTATLLTACAGLPTSGPVEPGLNAGDDGAAPAFVFEPDSPQPGASPQQIVDGFIRAGSGPGPANGWSVAREYLAPGIRDTWKPTTGVTIDVGTRNYGEEADGSGSTGTGSGGTGSPAASDAAIALTLTSVASVDATGVYTVDSGSTRLLFRLAKQPDGEWRISEAPDGIVLDQNVFPSVYHRYSLMYFDLGRQFLVPDLRWFPTTNSTTSIASALLGGASPWLKDSVFSAFPDSVQLDAPSVRIVDSVAQVQLNRAALTVDPQALDRMQTQLEASLKTATVTGVQMSVGGTPLNATTVPVRSTQVDATPLVLTAAGFGYLNGDTVQSDSIRGLSDAIVKAAPVAVQVGPDRDVAAVRFASGSVGRIAATGVVTELDDRSELIDPTIDPLGFVWSVPRDQPGALAAYDGNGQRIAIAATWNGATQVSSIALSRDGTRLAALVTSGGRSAAWIFGVVRDTAGVPRQLGGPLELSQPQGSGIGIAWLDDTTVGIVTSSGDTAVVTEQPIGGPSTTVAGPSAITAVAGANQTTTVRMRDQAGVLYAKRGSNWQQIAAGVLVLATQQGLPQ